LDKKPQMDERTWIDVARDNSTCTDVAQAGVQWRNIVFARIVTSLTTQERHWIKMESFIPPSIPHYVFSSALPVIFLKFVSLPSSRF
jgi:hypothetical protein